MTALLLQNFLACQAVHGVMTSQLRTFRARSILLAFVVPKLILLFTKAVRSAHPYSVNFGVKLFFFTSEYRRRQIKIFFASEPDVVN